MLKAIARFILRKELIEMANERDSFEYQAIEYRLLNTDLEKKVLKQNFAIEAYEVNTKELYDRIDELEQELYIAERALDITDNTHQ